jgi:hypothetical protein
MNFISMNEQINRFSRVILHSDNGLEKVRLKNCLKKVKFDIKIAKQDWNYKNLKQYKKSKVA